MVPGNEYKTCYKNWGIGPEKNPDKYGQREVFCGQAAENIERQHCQHNRQGCINWTHYCLAQASFHDLIKTLSLADLLEIFPHPVKNNYRVMDWKTKDSEQGGHE